MKPTTTFPEIEIAPSQLPFVCAYAITYNGKRFLERCFQTLQDLTDYGNCRLNLVDNGSSDGSGDYVRKNFPEVEVLRVSLQGSEILLLDEPAAGLSARERADFATLLQHLRDNHGKTVVLVEHDLDLVMGVADRITVLEAGSVIASSMPAEIAADPRVQGLFVGARHV